jgi:hypothetical protein
VIIGINVIRGIDNAGGSPADTTGPEPTVAAGGPAATIVPDHPTSGVVEFGTAQNANCTLQNTTDGFFEGARVFWFAVFTRGLGPTATVRWSLTHAGQVLDEGTGPASAPPGPWDTLCGTEPETFSEVGAYTLQVRTADDSEVLSTGTYTIQ